MCDLETSRIGAPYIYIYDISSLRVNERVELFLYSPSGPSWPVLGVNFTFTFNCGQIAYEDERWMELAQDVSFVQLLLLVLLTEIGVLV